MGRVAAVVFSQIPVDPRPTREAEALIEVGMAVDMICLRGENQPARETYKGINVYRINLRRTRNSKFLYILQYGYFILAAFLRLSCLHVRHRYQVIHVHNMPDVLVFCALIPRLTGARVVLDLHDPMSEIFITRYGITESHLAIRALKFLERLSIGFCHLVLTPNKAFREIFIARGCPEEKIHIVMNTPQENIFKGPEKNNNNRAGKDKNTLTLMYHGYISEYNGLDVAIEAVSHLMKRIPDVKLRVFGGGPYLDHCRNMINELNLIDNIEIRGYATLEEIAEEITKIDIGLIPNKSTPFTDLNFPTRIFEYLSMYKPLVCSRTRGVMDYFNEDEMCFYDPGVSEDLADKIEKLHFDDDYNLKITRNGYEIYNKYRWDNEKTNFIDLIRQQLGVRSCLVSSE